MALRSLTAVRAEPGYELRTKGAQELAGSSSLAFFDRRGTYGCPGSPERKAFPRQSLPLEGKVAREAGRMRCSPGGGVSSCNGFPSLRVGLLYLSKVR